MKIYREITVFLHKSLTIVLQNTLSLEYLKKIFVKHIHSYFNPMANNLMVSFTTALFTARLVEFIPQPSSLQGLPVFLLNASLDRNCSAVMLYSSSYLPAFQNISLIS